MEGKGLIFYDIDFPGMVQQTLCEGEEYHICDAKNLAEELGKDYSFFISMHGSYFPLDAADAFFDFLKLGKGFIHIGDTPPKHLCTYDKAARVWKVLKSQMSYYRKLNIHSVLTVSQSEVNEWKTNSINPLAEQLVSWMQMVDTSNFIMIPTKNSYIENEWGSVGSMDAKIIPLIKGCNSQGEHISSPVVLVENRAGNYHGGRWIFINAKLKQGDNLAEILKPFMSYVSVGYRELMVKPSMALYYEQEKAAVKIQIENFRKKCCWKGKIVCSKMNMTTEDVTFYQAVYETSFEMEGTNYAVTQNCILDIKLFPGIYQIRTEFESDDGEKQVINQGFCVYDKEILVRNDRITCGHDYFIINGRMTPVVGTTYMSGEVSRAFLQLPNAANWLSDMQDMKKQGINWVRTGIWCNWRNYMLDDGHFDEFILRSIDAYLQTAAYAGLHVTFTFFTFVPEAFEGTHPYLDKRSLEAQKRFISNIVYRHKETTNVDWDLINEPFTTDHPTQKKSEKDTWEGLDFSAYMEEQYGSIDHMLEKLDLTIMEHPSFKELSIPEIDNINFSITDMSQSKNGLIWRDYVNYTVTMFRRWVIQMRDVIKEINEKHMVTVGQDEALRTQRPSQLLYGDLVDYNCQHTWWLLDDLVWDTRFAKYYNKPLLVQETGIMYVEQPNGVPRREEADLARLLLKKSAYAYGTRCAGSIHWLWNTNCYLNNANESNIGAIRSDGSRKPEFFLYRKFAEFFKKAENLVTDIVNDEEIAVVFPYTNDFTNRSFAQPATSQITKILTYHLKRKFIAISEFDLEPIRIGKPKVIFVPSAHHFDQVQFNILLEIIKEIGSTLVFTGPISMDEYFAKTDRAAAYFGDTRLDALAKYEKMEYKGEYFDFSFDNNYVTRAFKETDGKQEVFEKTIGNGRIVWCGIPIDLAAETRTAAQFYKIILDDAGSKEEFTLTGERLDGIFISKTNWEKGALYTIVNEANTGRELCILDSSVQKEYELNIGGDESVLFAIDYTGKVIAVYDDAVIKEKERKIMNKDAHKLNE